MNNVLGYKGYIAQIEIDPDSNLLYGSVINTRDVITFTGETVAAARQAFEDSVEDYLAWAAKEGFAPEKPYSGKVILRISPNLHRDISARASMDGKSLNQWIASVLEEKTEITGI